MHLIRLTVVCYWMCAGRSGLFVLPHHNPFAQRAIPASISTSAYKVGMYHVTLIYTPRRQQQHLRRRVHICFNKSVAWSKVMTPHLSPSSIFHTYHQHMHQPASTYCTLQITILVQYLYHTSNPPSLFQDYISQIIWLHWWTILPKMKRREGLWIRLSPSVYQLNAVDCVFNENLWTDA